MGSWCAGRAHVRDGGWAGVIWDGDRRVVCEVATPELAAKVVRAVNAHGELVAALRSLEQHGCEPHGCEAGELCVQCEDLHDARDLLARIDAEEAGGG